MKNVCIIGGGAAGIMAAYSASSKNISVHLFEKNAFLGKKLLITGKGRCNITNMGDIDDYMANIPRNGTFLYSAFSSFFNYDIVSLLNENGLPTKIERGARVFPESDKSSDVVNAFSRILNKQGVHVKSGANLKRIERMDRGFRLHFENGEAFAASAVIIATGGVSYPKTGSTGFGHKIAKEMGHSVNKLHPSLTALKTKERFVKDLEGLSLKNTAIAIKSENGKNIYTDFGEMIFTDTGVSGPIILSASARIAKCIDNEEFRLYIDLKPALGEQKLDLRVLRDFENSKNKDVTNTLSELLPKRIIPVILEVSGIDGRKKVNTITKEERRRLVSVIKALPLTITATEGFDRAVVTCGGVNINEINPKTMESKLVSGLYFAGEIIDVDAYTGGYNLQIAFSTGYLAGKSAVKTTKKTHTEF